MSESEKSEKVVLSPEKMAAAKVIATKMVGILTCLVVWLAVLGIPCLVLYFVGHAIRWIEDGLGAPLDWLMKKAKALKDEAEPLIAEVKAAREAAKASNSAS